MASGPKKIMQPVIPLSPSFARLIEPLNDLIEEAESYRDCPSLSDSDWVSMGIQRTLKDVPSSRAFLQKLGFILSKPMGHTHFFENLKSSRRLRLCSEVDAALRKRANLRLCDALSGIECLKDFDVHAGDGHYHRASVHEARHGDGRKYPPGHFFALNLRTHALHSMTLTLQDWQRKDEHDMHALKRQNIQSLRQNAPKGRKVLYVWDRAGVDLRQWEIWKQGSGIYMLSRQKTNMLMETVRLHDWDESDPHNAGVWSDQSVMSPEGHQLRRVTYVCPESLKRYEFITNLPLSVPPGLVAHLYKMRWEIEKVFDQIKNKFGVRQAWSNNRNAKKMQAIFICLAHNLMLLLEQKIEQEEGIRNEPEIKRRAERLLLLQMKLESRGQVLPLWQRKINRMSQRSVKFVRWMEEHFWRQSTTWCASIGSLRHLYARL